MNKDNNETISLDVDYAKVIHEDETVCLVEMDILHLGVNRNQSIMTKEGVELSLPTIYNKPIITRFNCSTKSLATDYDTHAKSDHEHEQIFCVGVIPMPEYSEPRWVITEDGFERLRVNAIIWKFYADNTVRILENKNGNSKVSIEVVPIQTRKDSVGRIIIDEFLFLSCFMLGDSIMEGMEGSKLKVTKFSYEDIVTKSSEYLSKFSQRNEDSEDIFDKQKKGGKKVKISHNELQTQIWAMLDRETYLVDLVVCPKYFLMDIYDSHIVVADNETNEVVKFKYAVSAEGIVTINMESRKIVDYKKEYRTFAKEDIATESALQVDKTKISDDAWGGIDKTNLKERVIKANNFKEIAQDVFLDLRDGWQDGEVTKLKYPVMQLDGDTLVYNRGALAAAKGYAEKNNEEKVLEKLKSIYASLELDFASTDLNLIYACSKHDYEDNEDVVEDQEDEQDCETCEEASDGESPKQQTNMSADANVDVAATAEMLEKEAENNKELADEAEPDKEQDDSEYERVIAELNSKIEAYESELEELRAFKLKTEEAQKLFKMEEVFAEVEGDITEEQKAEFKQKANEYSLEQIGTWANAVKAEAFNSAKQKSTQTTTFARVDLCGQHKPKSSSNSIWDCVNKQ